MDDPIIARTIEILDTDPDFFVPLKKLWLMLQGEGLALDIEQEELGRMLLEDKRFEFTFGAEHAAEFEDDAPELAAGMGRVMEMLGFYSGERVKLTSRKMTAEDVFAAMTRNLTRMNEALQGAWEARPAGNQEIENQLIDILAVGQKLEREIQALVERQREDKE
ncbi:MAG: hypothetical protein DRP79_08170 [Planctomycetota bacterium]|nr:MAG: hypothetical protein B6I34_10810 [Anaerolineaceae bacterium 4572_32.1]RKY24166.1 MAG: hypothetical protein DRP79_08170 [Planctomycetota bacterium]